MNHCLTSILSCVSCRKQCGQKLALEKAKEKKLDLRFLRVEDIYGSQMIGSICDAALMESYSRDT